MLDNEERKRLDKIINILTDRNYIASKALGTLSITQVGIKKFENLLEDSANGGSIAHHTCQFIPSIDESERNPRYGDPKIEV